MKRATQAASTLAFLALSGIATTSAAAEPTPAANAIAAETTPEATINAPEATPAATTAALQPALMGARVVHATPPEAEGEGEIELPGVAAVPARPHTQHFSAGLGFRAGVVSSKGFDPYSRDNTLPAATVFGSYTPFSMRPASLHLAFEWDLGGSDATARGNESSLTVQRLALGLEARYSPISRLAFLVRAMPAAIHVAGTIEDAYLARKLETASWTWGLDLTAGAAARIAAAGNAEYPVASFWMGLDMGYRFAGASPMGLRPGDLSEDDQTRRFGEIPQPSLELSGFIARLSAWMSF